MNIPLTFRWTYAQADTTEYLQRSVELEPMDLFIVIELPLDVDLYYNPEIKQYWEDMKLFEIGMGERPKLETPKHIWLTPKGVAEARRLINLAFVVEHPYKTNNNPTKKTNDGWDDDEVIEE